MIRFVLAILVGLVLFPQMSLAGDEVINQLKFFYGQKSIDPKDINTVIEGDGIEAIKKTDYFGLEASRDLVSFVNLGLRINIGTKRSKPTDAAADGTYYSTLTQADFLVMLNFPFIKGDRFKAEIVSGFGASSSSLTIKTATQDGTFSQTNSLPTALVGAAIAIGHKYIFLRIEGGYEYSKVGSLDKKGTLTGTIANLDTSGSYVHVGILIDGLKLGKL